MQIRMRAFCVMDGEQQKERGGVSYSIMKRPDVDIVFVIDACGVHQSGHLALVFVQFFVVIVHGGLGLFGHRRCISIQVFSKPSHTIAAEYTEDISLLLCKLWWGFSAEGSEVLSQKFRDASQTQVRESWTVVDQWTDPLGLDISMHDGEGQ